MKCIVCLTDENLNTHMKVEIDGDPYEVHLCDEHADTTTMGHVNKKVKEIKDKLQNAVQLAIDLGISIPEINAGTVGKMPDLNIVQPEPSQPEPTIAKSENNKIQRQAESVKLSDTEEIACDTDITMQQVEVKGGKIDIPKHTEGDAGTSDIKICNVTDNIIQKKFKELKHAGDTGQTPASYVSDCNMCQGTGTHPVLKGDCPKCNGTGVRA